MVHAEFSTHMWSRLRSEMYSSAALHAHRQNRMIEEQRNHQHKEDRMYPVHCPVHLVQVHAHIDEDNQRTSSLPEPFRLDRQVDAKSMFCFIEESASSRSHICIYLVFTFLLQIYVFLSFCFTSPAFFAGDIAFRMCRFV